MADRDVDDNASDGRVDVRVDGVPDDTSVSRALVPAATRGPVGALVERVLARITEPFARTPARGDPSALVRSGGVVARWVSFPRGVRAVTAATSLGVAALAAWGVLALAGTGLGVVAAGVAAAASLGAVWGPISVRLASRLHRLVVLGRRHRIAELRALPDRRAVAVRGVVVARRTAASALEGRAAVWSLVRFRSSPLKADFFHEAAFDFLLDDGTDEPIWVEVAGGMLVDPFPPEERVQFHNTTLLELEHPFLTRLRLDAREVRGAELVVAPGDLVDVVGRLSRRLDPTATSESGREPPQRRALRSGTRIPVMVRRVPTPDPELARVRRPVTKGPPSTSPGEPPMRKF
ncbi:MAG TPA: hypothetical protein VHJ20_19740 [Polyangia bacterium]|nr:hypothetical protein [Polyangia bacterium]